MAVVFPYAKQTWTDGVSSCSAARNNVHEDGIFNAHNAPAVRVYHNANQSVTSLTPLALTFNTEIFDQAGGVADNMHDGTNPTRLTCRYAGVYLVMGNVTFAANATGFRLIQFRFNGTTLIGITELPVNSAAANTALSLSFPIPLAVNDYVELIANQNSGAGLNVLSGDAGPMFSMVRVA